MTGLGGPRDTGVTARSRRLKEDSEDSDKAPFVAAAFESRLP